MWNHSSNKFDLHLLTINLCNLISFFKCLKWLMLIKQTQQKTAVYFEQIPGVDFINPFIICGFIKLNLVVNRAIAVVFPAFKFGCGSLVIFCKWPGHIKRRPLALKNENKRSLALSQNELWSASARARSQ